MNKEVLRQELEKSVNNVLLAFMNDNDIKTGDVTPHQALDLDTKLDDLADLLFTIGEQNRDTLYTKEEVIEYVKDNTPQFIIDVGAPRDFMYNEGLLEDGEKYYIEGNTIHLYLE